MFKIFCVAGQKSLPEKLLNFFCVAGQKSLPEKLLNFFCVAGQKSLLLNYLVENVI